MPDPVSLPPIPASSVQRGGQAHATALAASFSRKDTTTRGHPRVAYELAPLTGAVRALSTSVKAGTIIEWTLEDGQRLTLMRDAQSQHLQLAVNEAHLDIPEDREAAVRFKGALVTLDTLDEVCSLLRLGRTMLCRGIEPQRPALAEPERTADATRTEAPRKKPYQLDIARRLQAAPPMPGADRAYFDLRKLTHYALDPNHPHGKLKAQDFEEALGYTKKDARRLRDVILQQLPDHPAEIIQQGKFYTRYSVHLKVPSLLNARRYGVVRTIWERNGPVPPSLVSCFMTFSREDRRYVPAVRQPIQPFFPSVQGVRLGDGRGAAPAAADTTA